METPHTNPEVQTLTTSTAVRSASQPSRSSGCCCSRPSAEEVIECEIQRLASLGVTRSTKSWTRREGAPPPTPHPVYVNVYHLVDINVNRRLKQIGLGIFHAGVQVFNEEWSFGAPNSPQETSGVFAVSPMEAVGTLHAHIFVGNTVKSREQVKSILRRVHCEWLAADYHVLGNNCNHFSERFCELLSTPERPVIFPKWINRISRIGDCFIPRKFANWAVTKVTCQEIPKCACVDYSRNTGTDVRVIAQQECKTDSVAMQFQIMALMTPSKRAARASASDHHAAPASAVHVVAEAPADAPPPAPRNSELEEEIFPDQPARAFIPHDELPPTAKLPPRPGVSRAGASPAPAVPRPANTGREPPSSISPTASRHHDPHNDPNTIVSPSPRKVPPPTASVARRTLPTEAPRTVTFAPPPAAVVSLPPAPSAAVVGAKTHISPLVEPPHSPEKSAFATESSPADGNAASVSLRDTAAQSSEVSASHESSPRAGTDAAASPLPVDIKMGLASTVADPRPTTPAQQRNGMLDDDDATFTVDHLQLSNRRYPLSAAPQTAAAAMTTVDDLTTTASDGTAAKVVTQRGGLTTLGSMSQSAGITENNAFLRRGDDDDDDDGLSIDETATWSHIGPPRETPAFSPREAG